MKTITIRTNEFSDEEITMVEERREEYKKGDIKTRSWEEVKSELLKKYIQTNT